jgi:hypothetical protein
VAHGEAAEAVLVDQLEGRRQNAFAGEPASRSPLADGFCTVHFYIVYYVVSMTDATLPAANGGEALIKKDAVKREEVVARWRDVFVRLKPSLNLVKSLLQLTEVGAEPVSIADLSKALGCNADETERLIGDLAWPWVRAVAENGQARIELVSTDPNPRYRYRIGARVIPVGGCAPDAFIAAQVLGRPMEVETTDPTTATPIRIDFGGDGSVQADPPTAVVAVIDPRTAQEALAFTDADQVDADICLRQPLFASRDAVPRTLTALGGQILTVDELHLYLKEFIS